MSVSERIIKRREELGFSQTELAKRAGLKPPAISQYESGTRSPSYEALIKLSNALDVSTDFLMSGKELNSDVINDNTIKVLLRIIQNFTHEEKEKLLEYATFLTKSYTKYDIPVFNESSDYANFIIKSYFNDAIKIDVHEVAKKLSISIYEDNLDSNGEGILLNGELKAIILNSRITNHQRKKFTIATLIGHAVIPWHANPKYEIRKEGSSTLLTDNIEDIEAQQFAINLIVPSSHVIKDFVRIKPTIDSMKKLASEKYDVSLFSFLNRLVSFAKDKHAVLQSENWNVIKTFQGNRPLADKIHPQSFAATFFINPSQVEETRQGTVPASYWLLDGAQNEFVHEESIYNPQFGKVLTLITISDDIIR